MSERILEPEKKLEDSMMKFLHDPSMGDTIQVVTVVQISFFLHPYDAENLRLLVIYTGASVWDKEQMSS